MLIIRVVWLAAIARLTQTYHQNLFVAYLDTRKWIGVVGRGRGVGITK